MKGRGDRKDKEREDKIMKDQVIQDHREINGKNRENIKNVKTGKIKQKLLELLNFYFSNSNFIITSLQINGNQKNKKFIF